MPAGVMTGRERVTRMDARQEQDRVPRHDSFWPETVTRWRRDGLQPIVAKAAMDIRKTAPVYGDRLAFFGNIDVMIMGTNDLGRIEEAIRSKFAAGMATREYAYHSDHSVPPQVSWKTYRAIIDWVECYGRY